METVGGNIDNLLDTKWDLSCSKIDRALQNNTYEFSPKTLSQVANTVQKVRNTFLSQTKLSIEIESCHTFEEMLEVLKGYRKSLCMNVHILNKVLWKAPNLEKAKKVLLHYGKWIVVNRHTINILFKLSTTIDEKKEILQTYWQDQESDIYLLNMMLAHAKSWEEYFDIASVYGKWLWEQVNAVTIYLLLKILFHSLDSSTKQDIPEILEVYTVFWFSFSDEDKVSLHNLVFQNKKYTQLVLDTIRNKEISPLYFLLPEKREEG